MFIILFVENQCVHCFEEHNAAIPKLYSCTLWVSGLIATIPKLFSILLKKFAFFLFFFYYFDHCFFKLSGGLERLRSKLTYRSATSG